MGKVENAPPKRGVEYSYVDRTAGPARCDGRLTNARYHPGRALIRPRRCHPPFRLSMLPCLPAAKEECPSHSLASFVCPGCPGARCGLRPYRPSARTLINAAPTPSLTGATRVYGRRISHVSHALLRATPPLDSVIRMSGAAHLTGIAGFPRPKIPKRLRYSLITSLPMASSRRAWLHDTPNSTLEGRR